MIKIASGISTGIGSSTFFPEGGDPAHYGSQRAFNAAGGKNPLTWSKVLDPNFPTGQRGAGAAAGVGARAAKKLPTAAGGVAGKFLGAVRHLLGR